jgi:S1-C subfamily serine protease
MTTHASLDTDLLANLLPALSGALSDAVERASGAVVAVNARRRMNASGILWQAGIVVTAAETVERDDDLAVTLPNGETVPARLVGTDPSTDVAVLRYEPGAASLPVLAHAEPPRLGGLALAVGRGETLSLAALGIVSALGGAWRSMRGGAIDRLIRLDVALNPRSEGGAVIDAAGGLVGMAVYGPRRGVLVIPMATIGRVADHLMAHGRIVRGYLGIGLQPVRLDAAVPAGRREGRAAIVVSVDARGPAKQAGVLLGDIVVGWDGEPVHGVRDVFERLGPESVGRTVALDLVRAGTRIKATITVSERPNA